MNEFGNYSKTAQVLTAATGHSYSRIIDLMRKLGDFGHSGPSAVYIRHTYYQWLIMLHSMGLQASSSARGATKLYQQDSEVPLKKVQWGSISECSDLHQLLIPVLKWTCPLLGQYVGWKCWGTTTVSCIWKQRGGHVLNMNMMYNRTSNHWYIKLSKLLTICICQAQVTELNTTFKLHSWLLWHTVEIHSGRRQHKNPN